MKQETKEIVQNSFYQLLVVYTLLVFLISLNLFWKYTLHFEIFAVVLAILGLSIISKEHELDKQKKLNKKMHILIFVLAIFFIFLFRAIPYINNPIPLGYDAGIYKYAIENGLKNKDNWIFTAMEPGFLYLMKIFSWFFSTNFILIWLFILFNVFLGISVYFFTKEYFGKIPALISIILYSVSVIQFEVFTLMYYKNIIGLCLMLFALYFSKKYENAQEKRRLCRVLFIVLASFLGAIHKPTFYIFGLSYFIYAFISPYKNKNDAGKKYNFSMLKTNFINGFIILVITGLFYIGDFSPAITSMFKPVLESFISPGTAPGTFINFFTYQFSTLAYLPLAILGWFYLARKKQFNILFIWTVINAIIVYFQFFFFNRFIIHLDIALIILASLGFSILIENKKKLGISIFILLIFSAGFVTFNETENIRPLTKNEQLSLITSLQFTEKNASVIAISSEYSPWVLAYSNRKTIAPGLFDENKWTKEEWNTFWQTQSKEETVNLLALYEKPIYLFAGDKNFNNPCFEAYIEKGNNKIYKYIC